MHTWMGLYVTISLSLPLPMCHFLPGCSGPAIIWTIEVVKVPATVVFHPLFPSTLVTSWNNYMSSVLTHSPQNYTCLLPCFTTHHISKSKQYVFIFLDKFQHDALRMQVLKSIPGIFYVLQCRIRPSYPTFISREQSLAVLWTFCSILPAQLLPVSPSNTLHEEAYWLFSSQEFKKKKTTLTTKLQNKQRPLATILDRERALPPHILD